MRKLTVKNFSVIKEAELEFGKITVLIGPQSSGKSLLCKLAYFLGGEIPGFAVESILNRDSWDEFLGTVIWEFKKWFLTAETSWTIDQTEITFLSHEYAIRLWGTGALLTADIKCFFSDNFKNLYHALARNPAKQLSNVNVSRSELRQDLFVEISLLLNGKRTRSITYIPSGRSLFSDTSTSIIALQNPDIDPITRRFAGLIAWDSRWKAGNLTTGRGVIQDVEKEINRIAGGTVNITDGKPYFLSYDERNLPLSVQSSGTLELLPMFNIINQLASFQEHIYARADASRISPLADISEHNPLVYLEEPEAHIFPKAQYQLIQLFAWLANDLIMDFSWVITTHSPYILTAFNTLIEAWRVGNKEGKREQVAAIIPEKYWVNENDFAAYSISDGVLTSIFSKEEEGKEGSGLIDGNFLDSVSDQLGGEFDKLLDIEYAS